MWSENCHMLDDWIEQFVNEAYEREQKELFRASCPELKPVTFWSHLRFLFRHYMPVWWKW